MPIFGVHSLKVREVGRLAGRESFCGYVTRPMGRTCYGSQKFPELHQPERGTPGLRYTTVAGTGDERYARGESEQTKTYTICMFCPFAIAAQGITLSHLT